MRKLYNRETIEIPKKDYNLKSESKKNSINIKMK